MDDDVFLEGIKALIIFYIIPAAIAGAVAWLLKDFFSIEIAFIIFSTLIGGIVSLFILFILHLYEYRY